MTSEFEKDLRRLAQKRMRTEDPEGRNARIREFDRIREMVRPLTPQIEQLMVDLGSVTWKPRHSPKLDDDFNFTYQEHLPQFPAQKDELIRTWRLFIQAKSREPHFKWDPGVAPGFWPKYYSIGKIGFAFGITRDTGDGSIRFSQIIGDRAIGVDLIQAATFNSEGVKDVLKNAFLSGPKELSS